MSFFGNILGSVIGPLLSGGFNDLFHPEKRQRAEEQRRLEMARTPSVDFQKLRDEAEAAGFNPLTALGATGGQGVGFDFNPQGSLAGNEFLTAGTQALVTGFNDLVEQDQEARRLEQNRMRWELLQSRIGTLSGVGSGGGPVNVSGPELSAENYQGQLTAPLSGPAGSPSYDFGFGSYFDEPAPEFMWKPTGAAPLGAPGRFPTSDQIAQRYGWPAQIPYAFFLGAYDLGGQLRRLDDSWATPVNRAIDNVGAKMFGKPSGNSPAPGSAWEHPLGYSETAPVGSWF